MFNENNQDLDKELQKHQDLCNQAAYFIKKETKTITDLLKQKLKDVSLKRA